MAKRSAFVAAVLLGALILLSACTSGGSSSTSYRNENFRSGSEGLRFTIDNQILPSRVYDDQGLDVLVTVENKGATDAGKAGDKVYLSGFDPNIITGIQSGGIQVPQTIGKSIFGDGALSTVSFRGTIRPLSSRQIDKYDVRLQVTGCYGYETVASANVCIDPDPRATGVTQRVCTPTSVGTGTQGAPVSVSSVDVDASPGKTRFKITIQNAGRGEPFRNGLTFLNKCNPNDPTGLDKYDELSFVELTDISISGTSIKASCNPVDNNHVRLVNGKATIYCDYGNIRGNAAFKTPLTVKLRYGYRDIQFRDITILPSE